MMHSGIGLSLVFSAQSNGRIFAVSCGPIGMRVLAGISPALRQTRPYMPRRHRGFPFDHGIGPPTPGFDAGRTRHTLPACIRVAGVAFLRLHLVARPPGVRMTLEPAARMALQAG